MILLKSTKSAFLTSIHVRFLLSLFVNYRCLHSLLKITCLLSNGIHCWYNRIMYLASKCVSLLHLSISFFVCSRYHVTSEMLVWTLYLLQCICFLLCLHQYTLLMGWKSEIGRVPTRQGKWGKVIPGRD